MGSNEWVCLVLGTPPKKNNNNNNNVVDFRWFPFNTGQKRYPPNKTDPNGFLLDATIMFVQATLHRLTGAAANLLTYYLANSPTYQLTNLFSVSEPDTDLLTALCSRVHQILTY